MVSQIGNSLFGSGERTVTDPKSPAPYVERNFFVSAWKLDPFLAFEVGELVKGEAKIVVALAGVLGILFY